MWNRKREIQDAQGRFDPTNAKALLGNGIGEVSRPSEVARPTSGAPYRAAREQALFVNAVQKWLVENTRLGIPAMFHEEALHGLVAPGGTHFPVPIGLASTGTRRSSNSNTWCPAGCRCVLSAVEEPDPAPGVRRAAHEQVRRLVPDEVDHRPATYASG